MRSLPRQPHQCNLLRRQPVLMILACLFTCLLSTTAALADVSEKDLRVLTRALSFVDNMPTGEIELAILYDPASAQSKKESMQLEKHLTNRTSAGEFMLTGKRYSINNIATLGKKAKIVYLTTGTESSASALLKAGTILISNNPDCVKGGQCVLAAKTTPKVQIHVSKRAADLCNITFDSTFRMMVTEH